MTLKISSQKAKSKILIVTALLVTVAGCATQADAKIQSELVYRVVESSAKNAAEPAAKHSAGAGVEKGGVAKKTATDWSPLSVALSRSEITEITPGKNQVSLTFNGEGQKKIQQFFSNKVGSMITWEACGYKSGATPVKTTIQGKTMTFGALPEGFTMSCLR